MVVIKKREAKALFYYEMIWNGVILCMDLQEIDVALHQKAGDNFSQSDQKIVLLKISCTKQLAIRCSGQFPLAYSTLTPGTLVEAVECPIHPPLFLESRIFPKKFQTISQ